MKSILPSGSTPAFNVTHASTSSGSRASPEPLTHTPSHSRMYRLAVFRFFDSANCTIDIHGAGLANLWKCHVPSFAPSWAISRHLYCQVDENPALVAITRTPQGILSALSIHVSATSLLLIA